MSRNEAPRVYKVGAQVEVKGAGYSADAEVIGQSIAGVTKIRTSEGREMLVKTANLRPKR